jgi:response regulator RpfG family c-di-GMP phosphodiesterase/serine/threonine protein kinase
MSQLSSTPPYGRAMSSRNGISNRAASFTLVPVLEKLLETSIVLAEDWQALDARAREEIENSETEEDFLGRLVERDLLTPYQAARVNAGTTFGLVLGSYRVLDRIGAGGMAVVFKAEHVDMRNVVAIKVLPLSPGQDPRLQSRFMAEMRTVARLRHPNIVAAMDAGRLTSLDPDQPVLQYLVMEYVPGLDLEEHVRTHGALKPTRACNLAHQIAGALVETHRFQMVHRDIKPSNIIVTPEDQAKLLDFGLSRTFDARMTQPGTVLGTLDFMAPEQARDASAVDIRADIYGLGGTLFWCLTGELPFPANDSPSECLLRRMTQAPPSAKAVCADVPQELDQVIQQMMAVNPENRFATPQAVMRALLPFLKTESAEHAAAAHPGEWTLRCDGIVPLSVHTDPRVHRVLIVDDEPGVRDYCREVLRGDGIASEEAEDGLTALEMLEHNPPDLVLLDVNLPNLRGLEVLRRLRETPPAPNLKVIMFSGMATSDEMAQMLLAGADDYLTKPFSVMQLKGRVRAGLRLKEAQDRAALLNKHLLTVNSELEHNLDHRDSDLVSSRNALVLALAKLVEHRDNETGSHLARMQHYCKCLALKAAALPLFADQIDGPFVEMLECCAPLHDIGKVGLPDHILLKPGKLSPDERILMQAHTTIGSETLRQVAEQHGSALAFLQMAIDITRHHHERFDGSGYPDRLAGNAIPLSARIAAICDVYDALRSRRVYKPALSHQATVQLMTEASPGHFDPVLLQAFQACGQDFDRIYRDHQD